MNKQNLHPVPSHFHLTSIPFYSISFPSHPIPSHFILFHFISIPSHPISPPSHPARAVCLRGVLGVLRAVAAKYLCVAHSRLVLVAEKGTDVVEGDGVEESTAPKLVIALNQKGEVIYIYFIYLFILSIFLIPFLLFFL